MKCMVCGNEHMDAKVGKCQDCGFELISWAGGGDKTEYLEIIEEMANDYRKNLRKNISVELLVPSYEKDEEGNLEMKSEDAIVLVEAKDAELFGNILWYPEKFARMDAGEDLNLQIQIKGVPQNTFKKEIIMKSPDWGSVFWRIGYLEEDLLHFRLVLGADGDEEKRLMSEQISMVC